MAEKYLSLHVLFINYVFCSVADRLSLMLKKCTLVHWVSSAFIPPRQVGQNRVPACLAGIKVGRVHLCRVAGNIAV